MALLINELFKNGRTVVSNCELQCNSGLDAYILRYVYIDVAIAKIIVLFSVCPDSVIANLVF